ncbi:MAG: hypothetical protein LBK58_14420 [Prevotellaceae bacterium]|jgi:hypothetical protein|nr:hypothetical protein [Prevotellaceae bacterium]
MIRNTDKRHAGNVPAAADGTAAGAFGSCREEDLLLMRCSPETAPDGEIVYKYDGNTPPKEITLGALEYIVRHLENTGYKFYRSKLEISKKINDFEFYIHIYGSDRNGKGYRARITIDCGILNRKFDEWYFGHNLGYIAADGYREWELYGKENYVNSVKDIIQKLDNYFIPLTNRFTDDIDSLVLDVVENGFYPDNEQMGYRINMDFLKRYGNRELLEKSIQKYYDSYISKHYEVHEQFKKILFELKSGQKIDPYVLRDSRYVIETIVENNLNIKLK